MTTTNVFINCQFCKARVQFTVAGTKRRVWSDLADVVVGGIEICLGECAVCEAHLVGIRKLTGYDDISSEDTIEYWSDAERIWPDPESPLSSLIPSAIRESLTESSVCLNAGAHTGSVAMSGRALEAIARHFTKKSNPEKLFLWAGINELHTNKVIDDRLYSWAKELHEHRNLASHASGATFSRPDAEDLLNFAVAICEYVFVVQEKYDTFIRRKENKKSSKKLVSNTK